jgi:protein arginine kinase
MLPLDQRKFADKGGAWLLDGGADGDVVVSCRTRLARNLEGYSFPSKLSKDGALELSERVRARLVDLRLDGETTWVDIGDSPAVVRLLLRERHLASRDLAPSERKSPLPPGRGVAFGDSETVSAMVNEEDHLRLQGLASGLDLDRAWLRVQELDHALEDALPFAHSRRLGYLTGCPTNVGTGLRASVMLHLPALGMAKPELEKVFAAAQRTGLAVRGMYGEGSRASGDFYQISNQVTLGRTEQQLVGDLQALVPHIVAFERQVRDVLMEEQRSTLQDRVSRSFGMLRTARALASDVALAHLSSVRLGVCLDLLPRVSLSELNRVAIQIQPGHVQALCQEGDAGDLADVTERDRLRASFLRKRLSELGN